METSVWPRVRAQRAFCEAEILARAAALILRGSCNRGALFNPLSALIAVSNPFNCRATLALSAFNRAIMSIGSPSAGHCSKQQPELCGSLHQRKQHPQSVVQLIAFHYAEGLSLPYSVLMNCLRRGFYSFRKFGEIEFDDSQRCTTPARWGRA